MLSYQSQQPNNDVFVGLLRLGGEEPSLTPAQTKHTTCYLTR